MAVAALTLLVTTGTISAARAAAPVNDAFLDAPVLSGTLPITVAPTNVDATKEPGEPDHVGNPGGASVWYRWTPAEPGNVTVHTCGSDFDTLLAVYTGDGPEALVAVAGNDDGCDAQSRVSFAAVAGTAYAIAVDGFNGEQGSIALTLEPTPPPPNDNFAAAEALSVTVPSSAEGTVVGATREPGEPDHAGGSRGASVWYTWAPAQSGDVTIQTCDSSLDTVLAVYTGDFLDGLTPLVSDDDGCGSQSRVTFAAAAGTIYRIAVDGQSADQGPFFLSLEPPPVNDDFAAAEVVPGTLPVNLEGSNLGATREPGEPGHAGDPGGASVWYTWTPAESGTVTIDACDSGFDTLLAVYTGDILDGLTPVVSDNDACGSQSRVTLAAVAGTTYRIAVDGHDARQGTVSLALQPPPANDDFAAAEALSGMLPITVDGTNAGATRESGEPDHAESPGGASVWYTWTPAESGTVSIETCDSDFDTVLAVYTGDTVAGLTPLVSNDEACGSQSRVTFAAVAGTIYRIAVDGYTADQGPLTLRLHPPPANDDFAAAEVVSGTLPISVEGSSGGATREPGEPEHAGEPGGASVWYTWTPAESGTVTIHTCDNGFDTLLAVYTGDTVDGLTLVVSDDEGCGPQSRARFDAVTGTTYRIAVDGFSGDQGRFTLRLVPPPINDVFAAAEVVSATLPVSLEGSNVGATREPDEPDHAGDPGGASVWYSWTPAESGAVSIQTCGSTGDTALAVYTGDDLEGLIPIVSDGDGCGGQSKVALAAVAGTTYRIAVDGQNGDQDKFTLMLAPVPANDDFASAQLVSGTLPITVDGSNVGASRAPGEPDHAGPGGASVWYTWTPAESGDVIIQTCGSSLDTLLAVYTGDTVDGLTSIGNDDDGCATQSSVTFVAVAGTTYRIAVDGFNAQQGPFTLTIDGAVHTQER